jgi:hypothetical protein
MSKNMPDGARPVFTLKNLIIVNILVCNNLNDRRLEAKNQNTLGRS